MKTEIHNFWEKYPHFFDEEPLPLDKFFKNFLKIDVYPETYDIILKSLKSRLVIYTGGIGWGKTFNSILLALRVLYELLIMKNPLKIFNVHSISFVIASRDESRARRQIYEKLRNFIRNSPLKKYLVKDSQKMLEFSKGIEITVQSVQSGIVGENLFFMILDEFNFIDATVKFSHIKFVHDILNRIESRFGKEPLTKLIVISSVTHPKAPLEKLIQLHPEAHVERHPSWAFRPELKKGNWFWICPGLSLIDDELEQVQDPRIIENEDSCIGCVISDRDFRTCGMTLIPVPEIYRTSFERDSRGFLRDMAGIPQDIETQLFSVSVIKSCVDYSWDHPFTHYETNLISDGASFHNWFLSNPKPIVVHFDLSFGMTSAIGVSIVSYEGFSKERSKPILRALLLLRIIPERNFKFSVLKEKIIYPLYEAGFEILKITTDKFQSEEFRKELEQEGFQTDVVETTPQIFITLKEYITENLLILYDYPPLYDELTNIAIEEKKIGKPRITKVSQKIFTDVATALASSVYVASRIAPPEFQIIPPQRTANPFASALIGETKREGISKVIPEIGQERKMEITSVDNLIQQMFWSDEFGEK